MMPTPLSFVLPPMHSKPRRYTLCLVCSMLAACGTVRQERKANALEVAVNAYGAAIRWGYYETACGFVDPAKRKPTPAGLKNVRVTGYDVVQPPVMQDEETATQVVQIEYLFEDVQRVHALTDRQRWHYDPATKSWWLESGVPEFK